MAAYNQRCAVDNWRCPTGNAPPDYEEEVPRPFPRPSVPSTITDEEKKAFAEKFKKLLDDRPKKKKKEEEEREAASAKARSELRHREQVKLKEAIAERAANAKKAAELSVIAKYIRPPYPEDVILGAAGLGNLEIAKSTNSQTTNAINFSHFICYHFMVMFCCCQYTLV